jgi:hypothetical protein
MATLRGSRPTAAARGAGPGLSDMKETAMTETRSILRDKDGKPTEDESVVYAAPRTGPATPGLSRNELS